MAIPDPNVLTINTPPKTTTPVATTTDPATGLPLKPAEGANVLGAGTQPLVNPSGLNLGPLPQTVTPGGPGLAQTSPQGGFTGMAPVTSNIPGLNLNPSRTGMEQVTATTGPNAPQIAGSTTTKPPATTVTPPTGTGGTGKSTTPVDNTKQIVDTQAQLTDAQAQLTALQKYGLTNTDDLMKDASGNWVAKTSVSTKAVFTGTIPTGIDPNTEQGQIDWYNLDEGAFTDWAKANNLPETQIYDIGLKAQQAEAETKGQEYLDKISQIEGGTYPLTAQQQAQVTALKNMWEATINMQKQANETYSANAETLAALAGRTKYNDVNVMGEVQQAIDTGINRVALFGAMEQAAVAAMIQGFMDNDFKMVTTQYNIVNDLNDKKTVEMDKIHQSMVDAQKILDDQAKQLKDDIYNQVTKPIQDITMDATVNGADQATIDALKGAATVQDAMLIGAKYLKKYTSEIIGSSDMGYFNIIKDAQGNIVSKTSIGGGTGGGSGSGTGNNATVYDISINNALSTNPDPYLAAQTIIDSSGTLTVAERTKILNRALYLSTQAAQPRVGTEAEFTSIAQEYRDKKESYEQALADINSNSSIANKDLAIQALDNVYNSVTLSKVSTSKTTTTDVNKLYTDLFYNPGGTGGNSVLGKLGINTNY